MNQCEDIKTEYEAIKALNQEFVLAYNEAIKTGNLTKAKELKAELEKKRDALREKLWPFEALSQKELKEQYDKQREILENTGILETLSTGELGIKAINNKEYAFPEYSAIAREMRKNKEIIRNKTEQGFQHLLIVPFGMKLEDLIEKYKQVILKHHKEGKLLATKKDPSEPDQKLELDESEPVWVWDEYKEADTTGKLVYFPKEFSKENNQGKTKQQLLEQTKQGFNILLIEGLPNIPREGKGKEIKNKQGRVIRKQLEANQTGEEYLKLLQTEEMYQNETGMTPEDQIIYAIEHLRQTNQVIDDWEGNGSISWQIGAFFPVSGVVPNARWLRVHRLAYLYRRNSRSRYSAIGVRVGVRIYALEL